MALFEVKDYDRKIYEEELRDFLPERILDVHTHVWLDELCDPVDPEIAARTVNRPEMVAKDNSIEDLQETFRLLFPGKEVTALMFSGDDASVANNAYVAESARKTGWPALYYSRPHQTADELEEIIRKNGFLGIN